MLLRKYKELFEKARGHGYECVAHAGEEGLSTFLLPWSLATMMSSCSVKCGYHRCWLCCSTCISIVTIARMSIWRSCIVNHTTSKSSGCRAVQRALHKSILRPYSALGFFKLRLDTPGLLCRESVLELLLSRSTC